MVPLMNLSNKGDWITNVPKNIKSLWPRRNVKMVQGEPKATETFSVDDLKSRGIVGAYLDEDIPEGIKSRELIWSPNK